MSIDARRCGASVDPVVRAVTSAIAALDRARARLYASEVPEVPDAKSVLRAWELASEVVEARALNSRPGWGIVFVRNSGVNQHGEAVISFTSSVFVECRDKGQQAP